MPRKSGPRASEPSACRECRASRLERFLPCVPCGCRVSCSSCRRCVFSYVRIARELKHAHCVRQNYSANQRKTSPLTVSESLSDDCLPRTVRLHWTRLVRCAAFYDRCWGLGAATARAKPQAAGDPVSSACGDADGPAVVEVGEAVVLSEGVLPLSTPAVATERCATEVPVTAPWGSPFGEVPVTAP